MLTVSYTNMISSLKIVFNDNCYYDLIDYCADNFNTVDDTKRFLLNIINNGCETNVVPYATYYHDINKLFDDYYDTINKLIHEYDYTLNLKYSLKTTCVWMLIEHHACELYNYIRNNY